jgi:hypothetical protein
VFRGSENILQFILEIQVIILSENPRMDDLVIGAMAGLRIKNDYQIGFNHFDSNNFDLKF